MNLTRSNVITILFALVLVGGGIYYFFFFSQDSGSALSTNTAATSEEEQKFTELIDQLGSITFDTSLLSDPRFMTRADIRTTVVPEASGRIDPFAPIPGATTK